MEHKSREPGDTIPAGRISRRRVLPVAIASATVVIVVAALLIPGHTQPPSGAPHGTGPTVNSYAPDFKLPDVRETSSNSQRFGAKSCSSTSGTWHVNRAGLKCQRLNAFFQQEQSRGFVVIGVDTADSASVAANYLEQLGITYPVVLDQQGSAASAYQIVDTPTSFLIDATGVVNYRVVGPIDQTSLVNHLRSLL